MKYRDRGYAFYEDVPQIPDDIAKDLSAYGAPVTVEDEARSDAWIRLATAAIKQKDYELSRGTE